MLTQVGADLVARSGCRVAGTRRWATTGTAFVLADVGSDFTAGSGCLVARSEAAEREAKALENYHGPRWWERERA
jgi:hypothetical protein